MSATPNIGCRRGHRFWTDRPEAWAGRACLYCYGNELTQAGEHRVKVRRCPEPLLILSHGLPHHGNALAAPGG